jgi:hypothetical protein
VEGDLKTDDGWLTLKTKIESRSVWRTSVKTIGIAYALHNWYQANTVRRATSFLFISNRLLSSVFFSSVPLFHVPSSFSLLSAGKITITTVPLYKLSIGYNIESFGTSNTNIKPYACLK